MEHLEDRNVLDNILRDCANKSAAIDNFDLDTLDDDIDSTFSILGDGYFGFYQFSNHS
jgi:hypothetical protein